MNLGNYPSEAYHSAIEIRDSLSETEITELKNATKGMPISEWWKWKIENEKLISQFVDATPSKRKTKKYTGLSPKIVLAGYQHCMEGYVILKAIDNHALFPGGSYRSMAANAGDAYQVILESQEVEEWPYQGESPFVN